MARGKTEKIGDILRNVLSRRAIAGNYQVHQVQRSLGEILSEKEEKHVRLGGIRKGCLTLLVDAAPLVYEFEAFRSNEILEELVKAGHSGIKKIRFEFNSSKR